MKTSIIGWPRVGANRELKFASERYFRGELDRSGLEAVARELRAAHWRAQSESKIDFIPSGDFSYYDGTLDLAANLNAIPRRFRELKGANDLDVYFAAARGAQSERGDVKALAMKKWFNTNYHYVEPELEDDVEFQPNLDRIFQGYEEARALGIKTRPTLIGPFTFLQHSRLVGTRTLDDFVDGLGAAFRAIIAEADARGVEWLQLEEPSVVRDLTVDDRKRLTRLYERATAGERKVKILFQTYFGDVRDCCAEIAALDVDGVGLDFVEGRKSLELVRTGDFLKNKTLFAGVVNGKNVWRNDYARTIELVKELRQYASEVVLGASCSFLHVPYSLDPETSLPPELKSRLAFATEKLTELRELSELVELAAPETSAAYRANAEARATRSAEDAGIRAATNALAEQDFIRTPAFDERAKIQRDVFKLPLLPTTTIGSFPQTSETRAARAAFRKGETSQEEYETFLRSKIAECVKLQEDLGLDVLVHGEYERNDMVEYFGENLNGFQFTRNAWVQSYGTRCVKPPIVASDVSRKRPITVKWSTYAQSLTDKPVKGMLTGPVTILNWSFPREDLSLKDQAFQIGLAIRDEVLDLEAAGIRIVQIDEAALREKLPLRREDWESEYLSWAIPAFRLVHSKVRPETQIHTHMCYSEFSDIIEQIDAMDADVISFEASRSNLQILDSLKASNFRTQVGPGVYDIHSPRVPSVDEIATTLRTELTKVETKKLWVNPDCGLKTRGTPETVASLTNLVAAARIVRAELN